MDPSAVADKIRHAFADVGKPTGVNLAACACDECASVRRLLEPHLGNAVPVKTLNWLHDSLPLLTPTGLQYYLQSYLTAALLKSEFVGTDMVMFHVGPSQGQVREASEYWEERLAVFSDEQKMAVRSFVDWFELSPDADVYEDVIRNARKVWAWGRLVRA